MIDVLKGKHDKEWIITFEFQNLEGALAIDALNEEWPRIRRGVMIVLQHAIGPTSAAMDLTVRTRIEAKVLALLIDMVDNGSIRPLWIHDRTPLTLGEPRHAALGMRITEEDLSC